MTEQGPSLEVSPPRSNLWLVTQDTEGLLGLGRPGMELACFTCFGYRNQAGVTPATTMARAWGAPGTLARPSS